MNKGNRAIVQGQGVNDVTLALFGFLLSISELLPQLDKALQPVFAPNYWGAESRRAAGSV
jgi:hypothetical protein